MQPKIMQPAVGDRRHSALPDRRQANPAPSPVIAGEPTKEEFPLITREGAIVLSFVLGIALTIWAMLQIFGDQVIAMAQ